MQTYPSLVRAALVDSSHTNLRASSIERVVDCLSLVSVQLIVELELFDVADAEGACRFSGGERASEDIMVCKVKLVFLKNIRV